MYRNKVDSKYARSQMEKHGWREGAGLGKAEHGMKDIIKVQLRTSRTGVGHDLSKEFTNNWWEDVYNKGAKSLKVENGKDGAVVSIVKEEPKKKKKVDKMALLYGRFRKGATLTTSDVGQVEVKHDDGHNGDSSDEDKPKKYLTFEEMYQACEGRTCHRGVRHGHSVSAKLKRVEEVDRAILSGQSPLDAGLPPLQSTHPPSTDGKKKKKKKKKEREDRDEEETPASKSPEIQSKGENSIQDFTPATADCDGEGLEQKKKKKRKKQKKEKEEEEEDGDDAPSSDAAATSASTHVTESVPAEEVSKKDKKKKKKMEEKLDESFCSGFSTQNGEEESEVKKEKKKKKKREENLDESYCNGFSAENGEEESKVKKEEKKKKRKRRSEGENFDENCSDCVEEETNFPCTNEVSAKKKAKKDDSRRGNSGDTDGEAEKVSKKKKRRKDNE